MTDRCAHCLRHLWLASGPITLETCHCPGNDTCRLVTQRNVLIASMRALLKDPVASRRTALAMIEEIVPSSDNCPLCGANFAVSRGSVVVHFAHSGDTRPCRASFKRVLGGALV